MALEGSVAAGAPPLGARAVRAARAAFARTWVQGVVVAAAVLGLYLLVGARSNPYDQYVRLADAFRHGHLYISDPPGYLEMARYDDAGAPCAADVGTPGELASRADAVCRGYVIDPPAPAVLLLPFVLLFGTALHTVEISMAAGAAAMGFFWAATRRLGWGLAESAGLTLLLAAGTDFWWAAADGGMWSFSNVTAVLFAMAALCVAAGGRRPWLVGLLVGCAGLARLPVFVGFPFFLYVVLAADLEGRSWRGLAYDRAVQRRVLSFGAGLGAMAAVVPAYNWARYGTIADKGYDHPQYADQPWFAQGRFDLSYIPRHVEAIFFSAPHSVPGFPYFAPTTAGTALFFVTPAFLLAFAARRGRLEAAAAVSLLLVAVPHVLHGTTGWAQFGYRYSLDYLPMLAVLTHSGLRGRLTGRAWLLVGLSVFMACWGPLYFFDTRLEDLLGHRWELG